MKKGHLASIAFAVLGALVIAGCGGSNDSTGGSSSGGSAEDTSAGLYGGAYGGGESSTTTASQDGSGGGGAIVSTGKAGDLGQVIVNPNGFTLYDFRKDRGTVSSCYGECEGFWPPLITTGEPQAGGAAQASLLGTTERKDGKTQVTYAGHPLYTFVEDTSPGEANGNDLNKFGGEWYALTASGEEPPH
jgi:predicted lipoprotein with Yx(FWY)xxD motif